MGEASRVLLSRRARSPPLRETVFGVDHSPSLPAQISTTHRLRSADPSSVLCVDRISLFDVMIIARTTFLHSGARLNRQRLKRAHAIICRACAKNSTPTLSVLVAIFRLTSRSHHILGSSKESVGGARYQSISQTFRGLWSDMGRVVRIRFYTSASRLILAGETDFINSEL